MFNELGELSYLDNYISLRGLLSPEIFHMQKNSTGFYLFHASVASPWHSFIGQKPHAHVTNGINLRLRFGNMVAVMGKSEQGLMMSENRFLRSTDLLILGGIFK